MKSFFYKFEDGYFIFFGDTDTVLFRTKEVAILVDKDNGVLLKHGCPEMVELIFEEYKDKYIRAGFDKEAKALAVLRGRFAISELNKIISHTGYIKRILERVQYDKNVFPVKETCHYCANIKWGSEPVPWCTVGENVADYAHRPKECPKYNNYVQALNPSSKRYVKIDLESGGIVESKDDDEPFEDLRIVNASNSKTATK
jgi:hypothetical protein